MVCARGFLAALAMALASCADESEPPAPPNAQAATAGHCEQRRFEGSAFTACRYDAIADMLEESPVYAYAFSGERFDCGTKLGYLKASVAYGLAHPDIGAAFRAHLRGMLD